MSKGCKLYIFEVIGNEKGPSLNEYLMLAEFSKVVPMELPELPPTRELDFTIEIKPNLEPKSKIPYMMTTREHCELQM